MNKKDILLVVGGIVVGYFLVGFYNKSKQKPETTGSTISEEDKAKQAKIDSCNKEVADFMATAKFADNIQLESIRKEKFDACMAKKA